MRSNYKKLGDYIRLIPERNKDLQCSNIIGLSTKKKFIPSIANIIGTDMTTYRIVRHNQFVYCPVTSRNSDKITVALYQEHQEAIISQAYLVFEVIDEHKLHPEYLMMWFRRPEFDRYARFMSHGSTRENFSWEEMCNAELPIPDIAKQREIVKEYNVLVNRITLNNQLIQKLEETAQAIYKQWFVDFEFPDQNGKPYKSNCGEMVESELGEIPKDWEVQQLGNLIEYKKGFAFKSDDYLKTGVPIIRVSNFTNKSIDINNCFYLAEDKSKEFNQYKLKTNDIVISTVGSWPNNPASIVGKVIIVPELANNALLNQNAVRIRAKESDKQLFIYYCLMNEFFSDYIISGAQGSANQASVTLEHIFAFKIVNPNKRNKNYLFLTLNTINKNIVKRNTENYYLLLLKNLLLSKLTKIKI